MKTLRDTFIIFGILAIPYLMYEWFGIPGALLGIAFLIASSKFKRSERSRNA